MSNLEIGMWLVVAMGLAFIIFDKLTSKKEPHHN